MKALVTGGAGFIGSHLCELLLSEGHEVVVVDNLTSGRLENIEEIVQNSHFSFHKLDILDEKGLKPLFNGVDWVFHLAGLADVIPSIEEPHRYFATNVGGALNVLRLSKEADVKRFIYAASSSCYGIPDEFPTPETAPVRNQHPYALTKYMGEELVTHWSMIYGLSTVSLRLFNVFGPRSRTTGAYGAVFGVFLAQKINGLPFTVVGDGNQSRDFIYVKDVAEAFLKSAQSNISGEIMNVGSGRTYSVNRLVELLGGEVIYAPKRPGEPDSTVADISKIEKLTDWRPSTSFEEGVAVLLEKIDDWRDAPVWDTGGIEKATSSWFRYLAR